MTSIDRIARRYYLAIPEPERERIEAAIPDGLVLSIAVGHRGKPGTVTVGLRTSENRGAGPQVRGRLTPALCWAALREVRGRVTTDAQGNVTEWETVA